MDDEDVEIEVCIRRKSLADAWGVMQSCDTELWTDVCDLYSMVVAYDLDPSKYEGMDYVQAEVAEAKAVMEKAELLAAVEIIESYNQEEWKQETAPSCVRRGS
eukprot:130352_1